jgi:hypothetical protein
VSAIATITIKKADGTTDVHYDPVTAAQGDGNPAVWRLREVDAAYPVGLTPTFEVITRWNGPKTARVMTNKFVYPFAVNDITTTTMVSKDRVVIQNGQSTMPVNIPATVLSEAAAEYSNLMGSAAVKSILSSGYAPTS